MAEPKRCPNCQNELPPNAPHGLCPVCLLGGGNDDETKAVPGGAGEHEHDASVSIGPASSSVLAEIGEKLGRHTKVAHVHGGDIADMHRRITGSGRPVRANRILAIASKMFSLSLVPLAGETSPWRNAIQGNPCKGIERNHEEGR